MHKPPLAEIRRLSPNARATLISYQISYWAPKARMTRNGFTWVVKSRQDLADETGLSVHQVKRALREIKKSGVLVVERHLFYAGIALWIRFPEPAVWESIGAKSDQLIGAKSRQLIGAKSDQPIPEDYKQGTTDKGLQNTKIEEEISGKEFPGKKGGNPKMKYGGKVSDIIGLIQEAQKSESSEEQLQACIDAAIKSPTAGRLVKVWTCAWVRAGIGFCPKPNVKDQTTLKHLVGAFGPQAAVALIVESITHWVDFSGKVQAATGFSGKPPTNPVVWFLWTHRALGLAWLQDQQKSPPEATSGGSATVTEQGEGWELLD